MMVIQITERFQIKVDTFGNFQPVIKQPGGEVIKFGKHVGELSTEKWVTVDKYFNNYARVLKWGIEAGVVDNLEPIHKKEEISVSELMDYLNRFENIMIDHMNKATLQPNDYMKKTENQSEES